MKSRKLSIDPVECIDCRRVCAGLPGYGNLPVRCLPEKWRHDAEIDASYVVGGKFQADKFKK